MTSPIRRVRDLLRPVISGDIEYKVRRSAFKAIPSKGPRDPMQFVHACAWKTASQWVRLILSDPRMYRHIGAQPFVWAQIRRSPEAMETYKTQNRSILLAAFASAEEIDAVTRGEANTFFVVRDPRLMLVSWYYSTRFTHIPTEGVDAHRAAMDGMTDNQAFSYCAEAFVREFGPILNSWAERKDSAKIVHFEKLVSAQSFETWTDLLSSLGLDVPNATLKAVLGTYSMDKLARTDVSDAKDDKYASRSKRVWPDYLTEEEDAHIQALLAPWVTQFGYEPRSA